MNDLAGDQGGIVRVVQVVEQGNKLVAAYPCDQVILTHGSAQPVGDHGEQQITQAIEAVRDMNRQISTAADEQTSVAEDISRNITEITDIAAANQKEVDSTSRASQTLHELSGELGTLTGRLSA